MKSDPALRDLMSIADGDGRYSAYYLQPRSQEDLRRRNRAHRKIAEFCFGLMGRTPDAVAGNITGLSMKPEVFDAEPGGNRSNLLKIYDHMCRRRRRATRSITRRKGCSSRPCGSPPRTTRA
jgi:4-hydroxyphenylacetate 3-monooxygenase